MCTQTCNSQRARMQIDWSRDKVQSASKWAQHNSNLLLSANLAIAFIYQLYEWLCIKWVTNFIYNFLRFFKGTCKVVCGFIVKQCGNIFPLNFSKCCTHCNNHHKFQGLLWFSMPPSTRLLYDVRNFFRSINGLNTTLLLFQKYTYFRPSFKLNLQSYMYHFRQSWRFLRHHLL